MLLIVTTAASSPKTIVELLQKNKVQAEGFHLPKMGKPGNHHAIYLIDQNGDLASLSETIPKLRETHGEVPIVACVPTLGKDIKTALAELGVDRFITPTGWDQASVGDRVLADWFTVQAPSSLDGMVGGCDVMQPLYEEVKGIAPLDDHALILAETGCGKEHIARALHLYGRPSKSWIAVNCAALSPELIDSELFGHKKGAFTGAEAERRGLILEVGEGTIFLDEIGELTIATQAKLLRFLEDHLVRPVGANDFKLSSARVVMATLRNLEQEVEEGRFRKDLYERIKAFTLEIPPLRERKADIPILARHFIAQFAGENKKEVLATTEMDDLLFRHDFPGNVRQLRSAIRYAAAFTDAGQPINLARLKRSLGEPSRKTEVVAPARGESVVRFRAASQTWKEVHDEVLAAYIKAAIREADGNKQAAAELSGMSRATFYEKIARVKDLLSDEESE